MTLETIALTATIVTGALSVGLNGVMWFKIGGLSQSNRDLLVSNGKLEKSNKELMQMVKDNVCPWGKDNCPSFKRAQDEAAPPREVKDG